MLDQLVKLVQQNAGDAIVKNPAIPDSQNNAAIQDVASNIFSGLQSQAQGGNVSQLMGMFQGGGSSLTNNPVVAGIISKVAGSLASKFGVAPQTAQQIASTLLPKVMNQFVSKTNDPNDRDFDMQDMLKQFTGNGNIGDMLGKFGGGKSGSEGIGGMLGKMF
jgi:hypothetical protein